MPIYRSVPTSSHKENKIFLYRNTSRPPSNVPYIVDNLWEWKRPDKFPNRRKSVYASPKPELAQQWGGNGDGEVFEVQFLGTYKAAQIKQQDSRNHPEAKPRVLIRQILQALGQEWIDSPLLNKSAAGLLWAPCLDKEDVELIFDSIEPLKQIKNEIWESITYWDDAELLDDFENLSDDGELFFEPFDGYKLISF